MECTKQGIKRKNTISSYFTKTPKLQTDNLGEKDKLVSSFTFLKVENDSVMCYTN